MKAYNKEFWLEELTPEEFDARQRSTEHDEYNRVLNILIMAFFAVSMGRKILDDPVYAKEKGARYLGSILSYELLFMLSVPESCQDIIRLAFAYDMPDTPISTNYNLIPPYEGHPPCVVGFDTHRSAAFFEELAHVDLDELVKLVPQVS